MGPKRRKIDVDIVDSGKIAACGYKEGLYKIVDTSVSLKELCDHFKFNVAEFRTLNQDNPHLGVTKTQLQSQKLINLKTKFQKDTMVVCQGPWNFADFEIQAEHMGKKEEPISVDVDDDVTTAVDAILEKTKPDMFCYVCDRCGAEFSDAADRRIHEQSCRHTKSTKRPKVHDTDAFSDTSGEVFGVRQYSDDESSDDNSAEERDKVQVEPTQESVEGVVPETQQSQESQDDPGPDAAKDQVRAEASGDMNLVTSLSKGTAPQEDAKADEAEERKSETVPKVELTIRRLLRRTCEVRSYWDENKGVFDIIQRELKWAYKFTKREELRDIYSSVDNLREAFDALPEFQECCDSSVSLRSFNKASQVEIRESYDNVEKYYQMLKDLAGPFNLSMNSSSETNFKVVVKAVNKLKSKLKGMDELKSKLKGVEKPIIEPVEIPEEAKSTKTLPVEILEMKEVRSILSTEASAMSKCTAELMRRMKELEEQKKRLEGDLKVVDEEKKGLENKTNELKSELEKKESSVKESDRRLSDSSRRLSYAMQQNQHLYSQMKAMHGNYEQKYFELKKEQIQSCEELQKNVATKQKELASLQATKKDLDAKNAELAILKTDVIPKLQHHAQGLATQLNAALSNNSSLMTQVQVLNTKIDDYQVRLLGVNSTILNARGSWITGEAETMMESIKKICGEISFYEAQRHAMNHVLPLYKNVSEIVQKLDVMSQQPGNKATEQSSAIQVYAAAGPPPPIVQTDSLFSTPRQDSNFSIPVFKSSYRNGTNSSSDNDKKEES